MVEGLDPWARRCRLESGGAAGFIVSDPMVQICEEDKRVATDRRLSSNQHKTSTDAEAANTLLLLTLL